MNLLTSESTRLGFIGIGNMGSRIARRLLERGYKLTAYNRRREAAEALVKDGATIADSIATLASNADSHLVVSYKMTMQSKASIPILKVSLLTSAAVQ